MRQWCLTKKYCNYFEEQLQGISSLRSDASDEERIYINIPMYQKILLVSILDTLGRARFPDIQKNRDRFIRVIKECSDFKFPSSGDTILNS
jgi:hypothetical protein